MYLYIHTVCTCRRREQTDPTTPVLLVRSPRARSLPSLPPPQPSSLMLSRPYANVPNFDFPSGHPSPLNGLADTRNPTVATAATNTNNMAPQQQQQQQQQQRTTGLLLLPCLLVLMLSPLRVAGVTSSIFSCTAELEVTCGVFHVNLIQKS